MGDESQADPKTILLAQRDEADLRFIRLLLEKVAGFQVFEARTAREVIAGLRHNPDLILVDVHVEGNFMKALELMRRMPKLNHVGIAILTGDGTALERCLRKGLNGYIEKPLTPEVLLAKVWKVLDAVPPLPDDGGPAKLEVEVEKIEGLPTLPTVYAQVEKLCQNPDVDADDLARVIESDPSVTMKLLKLSNSAFFGFRREIKTMRDAVSLLGNQTVKNAVLSISVFEAMKETEAGAGLDRNAFWRHATAVGSVARFLAGKLKIEREEAFTAGILHDIGKVILDGLFSDYYAGVLQQVEEKEVSILEAEQTTLGLTHTRLGEELAESWEIPGTLVEAISSHHRPGRASADPELASLVHIGDAVGRSLAFGSGGDPYVPIIVQKAFTNLGMTSDDLVQWEDEMTSEIEKDMSFLSAIA